MQNYTFIIPILALSIVVIMQLIYIEGLKKEIKKRDEKLDELRKDALEIQEKISNYLKMPQ